VFSSLPGFRAGSGPNQGPVGCLAASITLIIMIALIGEFCAFMAWVFFHFA